MSYDIVDSEPYSSSVSSSSDDCTERPVAVRYARDVLVPRRQTVTAVPPTLRSMQDRDKTEVVVTDPNTGAMKGQKLERFDLIPWDAMEEVARLYGKGAIKYEENNWLRGYKWSLSVAAMFRHIVRFMTGEVLDDGPNGTGCHHMACVVFHALAIMTFGMRGLGTDDRTIPVRMPGTSYGK